MKLGMQVGLGPGHIVLDENLAPSPPNFRPMSIVAKRLDGSRWHLAWKWASVQATGPRSRPQPMRHCVRWPKPRDVELWTLPAVTRKWFVVHNQPSSQWNKAGPVVAELMTQPRVCSVGNAGVAVVGCYKRHSTMPSTSRLVPSNAGTARTWDTESTASHCRRPSAKYWRVCANFDVAAYVMINLLSVATVVLLSVGLPLIGVLSSSH